MDYTQELDPISNSIITIRLYKNIKNIQHLCENIKTLPVALLKASLILDPFQVVVAANKAVTTTKMITHTVYSETMFNLSIQNNIMQSFKTFGINEKWTGYLLAVVINKIDKNDCSVFKEIEGEQIDLSCLEESSDLREIKKCYKLSDIEGVSMSSVVNKIACKECL